MTLRRTLLTALLAGAVLASPAQANYVVGMGDQDAAMFDSSAFQQLNIKRVRYLVPYDWFKNKGIDAEVTGFMNRAQVAGAEVLVHFTARRGCYENGHYSTRAACRAPSVSTYKSNFKRFRAAFPQTTVFGVWNEGNHVSQPIHNKPKLGAKYFLAARSACRTCTFVAADVLDSRNMESWIRAFDRFDKGKASIFGLHNYSDVNRKRSSGTKRLLRLVGGQVWLTETGGILKFLPQFPRSEARQAARTKYMFSLASKYDTKRRGLRAKITRLYNYQYTGSPKSARFDAGLVNPSGSKRKAFNAFKTAAASKKR